MWIPLNYAGRNWYDIDIVQIRKLFFGECQWFVVAGMPVDHQ